ncbi:MAG: RluA family pseudouridine synthase [Pseudomonadota bacterium]
MTAQSLTLTHTVTTSDEDQGGRLDRWLTEALHRTGVDLTRSRVQGLISDGHVHLDERPVTAPSTKIKRDQRYSVTIPAAMPATIAAQPMPLDVVFEDAHLIIINKAPGLVVHPGAGNTDGTLVNALIAHCGDSLSGIGGVARPGIVHRIDKDTSGLLVVAKHDEAHLGLAALFAEHDIERAYLAVIPGALRPGVGTVETLLGRNSRDRKKMAVIAQSETRPDARRAITHYRTLKTFGRERGRMPGEPLASMVECRLETGRTHQIRVHMHHLGAPLLGDPVYGRGPGLAGLKPGDEAADKARKTLRQFTRQALHARDLGFVHPITNEELSFCAAMPKDMQALVDVLSDL